MFGSEDIKWKVDQEHFPSGYKYGQDLYSIIQRLWLIRPSDQGNNLQGFKQQQQQAQQAQTQPEPPTPSSHHHPGRFCSGKNPTLSNQDLCGLPRTGDLSSF